MSSANFCALLQCAENGLRSAALAAQSVERPTFHPELGKSLRAIREAKGWSVSQARIQAKGRGHTVSDNQLRWLEQGKTKSPDQEVLRAVAAIYGFDYMELARKIVEANYGSDLLRHAGDHRSGSHQGGPTDVPASDVERHRLSVVEAELRALKAQYREVSNAARAAFKQLGKVAKHLGQSEGAHRAAAVGGRAHRGTASATGRIGAMKWGHIKKRFENAGVEDDDEMDFIDISDDAWEVEWRDDRFCGIAGDAPDDGLNDVADAGRRARLAQFEREHPGEYAAAWSGNLCICGHEHGHHEEDRGRCFAQGCECGFYCEPGAEDDD
jgi:transcriptional regulator with XRE-family HTH domain